MDTRRTRSSVAAAALLTTTWWAAACAGGGEPSSTVAVRDSAGVRVVENTGTAGVAAPWTVSPEPLFRVGWAPGGPELQNVVGVVVLPDGRIVFGDQGSGLLYVLSPDGEVLETMGGQGEGPGEFGRMMRVVPLGADTFLVADMMNPRVTTYAGTELLGDAAFGVFVSNAMYSVAGSIGASGYLLTPFAYRGLSDVQRGWDEHPVLHADRAFQVDDTLGTFRMVYWPEPGDLNPARPFGELVLAGDRAAHATTDRPEVIWFDAAGGVAQIARWDAPERPASEAEWTRYAESRSQPTNGSLADPAAWAQRMADRHRDFAGPLPYFRTMYGDREGNVWLGEHNWTGTATTHYSVIGADGTWIGAVDLPHAAFMLDVTDDLILGVEKDDLDVQAVVAYRLDKSG